MSDRAINHDATAKELEQRLREEQDVTRRLRRELRHSRIACWLAILGAVCSWVAIRIAQMDFETREVAARSEAAYWRHALDECKPLLDHALSQWEHVVDIGEQLVAERDQCWNEQAGAWSRWRR